MNDKGVWGEEQAVAYLMQKGYRIVERNFKTRFGEIDIIAEERSFIVFVEVKTRANASFAAAREFVTYAKQGRILTTAESWLAAHQTNLQPRFDVIEVYGAAGRLLSIEHFDNAF